jgi:hypothetical protein
MELKRFARPLLAVLFLLLCAGVPRGLNLIRSASAAQNQTEKKEVKVWVNTKSGVYHCPGTRWYGKTKEGKYMSECEAQKAGHRPAYGKPCGSDCK